MKTTTSAVSCSSIWPAFLAVIMHSFDGGESRSRDQASFSLLASSQFPCSRTAAELVAFGHGIRTPEHSPLISRAATP